ncbi:MAG: hypothetical protein KJO06_05350 [Gemmatimonadetes bacterium]|nr:hypothetical protein [Gemmatimonadota bacterium]
MTAVPPRATCTLRLMVTVLAGALRGGGRRALAGRAVRLVWIVTLSTLLCPGKTVAQVEVEVGAGLLMVHEPSVGGRQIGPLVAVSGSSSVLGVPLYLELGAGRTDFASLGQNYHHDHYVVSLGAGWSLTQGATRLGLRLGLGAYGELETIETDPPSAGGGGWVETVIPGLVLEHDIAGGRRVVLRLADAILGPWFAVLDPAEYGIDHRFMILLGIRF